MNSLFRHHGLVVPAPRSNVVSVSTIYNKVLIPVTSGPNGAFAASFFPQFATAQASTWATNYSFLTIANDITNG